MTNDQASQVWISTIMSSSNSVSKRRVRTQFHVDVNLHCTEHSDAASDLTDIQKGLDPTATNKAQDKLIKRIKGM
ncbi:hypothetical protein J1614_003287 [Plenodomus biglobosus]|nr:hypothetical protein J1614_003287 [Plenodomus biglobosus]